MLDKSPPMKVVSVDPPEGSDTVYRLGRTDLANIIATERLYQSERKRPYL